MKGSLVKLTQTKKKAFLNSRLPIVFTGQRGRRKTEKMGSERERDDESLSSFQDSCFLSPPLKTLFVSFGVLLRNPRVFVSIFALTTLPLSLLLFSQSLSSHPIKTQIYHLEIVAALSPTRFEARHVWKESRAYAISLVRLNALFFFPSYFLSLLAAITAVHSTALFCNGKRPSLFTAITAVRTTWKRVFVSTICVYAVMAVYLLLQRSLVAAAAASTAGLHGIDLGPVAVAAVGLGIEVYLMAVLSFGVVVSVMEERWGWDAIRIGWGLMEGRRFSGWVLSGILVLGSACVGWEMEETIDGGDWWWLSERRLIEFGNKAWLVCLFGVVVLWSYVLITVFYCDCRRRLPVIRGEYESEIEV